MLFVFGTLSRVQAAVQLVGPAADNGYYGAKAMEMWGTR